MAFGDFIRYVDQIEKIQYHKYDVVVNFFDLKFNYKNIYGNENDTYTFKIAGVVEFIEPREYTIYQATRPALNARSWVVRVPEIHNNQIPSWNTGTGPYNISKLPWKQYIDTGLNYSINETGKLTEEGPVSRYIGLYEEATVIDLDGVDAGSLLSKFGIANGVRNPLILQSGPAGLAYVSTNTQYDIAEFVRANYSRSGKHPCLTIKYDPLPPAGNEPEKEPEYFEIPLGVVRYKVSLTNDRSGESSIAIIDGTLWNNKVYEPVQQIYSPLPTPGDPATATINYVPIQQDAMTFVPDVMGKELNDALDILTNSRLQSNAIAGIPTVAGPRPLAVYMQDPPPGTKAKVNDVVTITWNSLNVTLPGGTTGNVGANSGTNIIYGPRGGTGANNTGRTGP